MTVLGFFFGAQSASEDIRALSAVPASTSLKVFATTVGSSWNCAVLMLSREVVVRAASAGPAGEPKLRLVVARAQGAARDRDVRACQNICDQVGGQRRQHECLSTQVLRRTKSRNQPHALLSPAVSSAEALLRLLLVAKRHY